jgi:hypothetical protein
VGSVCFARTWACSRAASPLIQAKSSERCMVTTPVASLATVIGPADGCAGKPNLWGCHLLTATCWRCVPLPFYVLFYPIHAKECMIWFFLLDAMTFMIALFVWCWNALNSFFIDVFLMRKNEWSWSCSSFHAEMHGLLGGL